MTNLDDTQPKKTVEMTQKLEDTKPKRPENFPPAPQAAGLNTPHPQHNSPQGPMPPAQGAYYPPIEDYYDAPSGPPGWLLWGVILLFVLGVAGTVTGVLAFREALTPGQQARVMSYLPFMEAFLPSRPGAGDTIAPSTLADPEAAQRLLEGGLPLITDTDADEAEPESAAATAEDESETTEATEASDEASAEENPAAETEPETEPQDEASAPADEAGLGVASLPMQDTMPEAQPAAPEIAPTPTPAPTEIPAPPSPEPVQSAEVMSDVSLVSQRAWAPTARNYGFRYERQGWNNCGPATITMALSYYGWTRTQDYAASYLKPSDEDKNVSPHEMVRFVNERSDLRALARMGGDLDLLRILVDNGFPVIIERSHMFEGYEWLGHYQAIVGYADAQRIFFIYDSFLGNGSDGEGITETYAEVDNDWQHFNRIFVVVYEPSRESLLLNLLGERANPLSAAEYAFDVAQAEARANPQDVFAWFNMGTSLAELGRYEEAAIAYDRAFELGVPWRMLWYQFGPFEAYYNVGRYQDLLTYVGNNLSNGGEYVEETHYWHGRALAAMGDTAGAATAFRRALSHNRLFTEARDALAALSQ